MKIGYDAKRAFFNNRGLGNYSRNTIQLMSRFYPEEEFFLFSPKKTEKGIVFQQGEHSMTVTPKGIWNPLGSLWRTFGMVSDIRKLGLDIYHGLSHEIPVGIEKTHTKSVDSTLLPRLRRRERLLLFDEEIQHFRNAISLHRPTSASY